MQPYEWNGATLKDTTGYEEFLHRYIELLDYKTHKKYMLGLIEDYTFRGNKDELLKHVKHYFNKKEFQDGVFFDNNMINYDIMLTQLNNPDLVGINTCVVCFKTLVQGPKVFYCGKVNSICGKCKKHRIQRHYSYPVFYIYIEELNICTVFLLFRTIPV